MDVYEERLNADIYDDGEYKISVPRNQRTNVLLVHKPLGKTTPTTRTLPGPGHTYGFVDLHDDEGAGDVVGSWQHHRRAPEPVPGKDFVKLNKYASMSGATTAKNFATFRRCNDIRLGDGAPSVMDGPYFPDSNTVYGRPSPDSAPMSDLISNAYQRRYIAEQRVAAAHKARQRTGRPKYAVSQHTKASLGHTKVPAPEPKPMFKLKQFQDVPSRISTQNYAAGYAMTTGSIPKYGRRSEGVMERTIPKPTAAAQESF